MSFTVTTSSAFAPTSGPTFSASHTYSTAAGMSTVINQTITSPATAQIVEIGGGATAQIASLFMSVSAACTITINSASNVLPMAAGDFISLPGGAAAVFLNGLSSETTFDQLKLTTSGADVVLNVAILFYPEALG